MTKNGDNSRKQKKIKEINRKTHDNNQQTTCVKSIKALYYSLVVSTQ